MEIFVDFGLFEFVTALGLTAFANFLYSRRGAGILVLLLSVVIPLALLIIVRGEDLKLLATANLGLALVNAAVALEAFKKRNVSGRGRGAQANHERE